MRKRVRYLLSAVSSSFFVLFVFIGSCSSVAVAPNESLVEGIVSEYAIVASRLVNVRPEQTLYRVTVYVESADKIGRGADFLSGRTGQDVVFYSKEIISAETFGKRVTIKATFRGDERGGMFWIREIRVTEE